MECRHDAYLSYYIDANGLLKGKWGGFKEIYNLEPNGETVFDIYYTHFSQWIPINEIGLFYNKFSCLKYDGILKLPKCGYYICEKNGRFGLITEDEEYILHVAYNDIKPFFEGICRGFGMRYLSLLKDNLSEIWKEEYKDNIFFIVTTETGKFLLNLSNRTVSAVYDDIFFSGIEEHSQIIYKNGDKYGAIDIDGNVLLKPFYDSYDFRRTLIFRYQKIPFNVWVNEGMYYGIIPTTNYDLCLMVGNYSNRWQDGCFFICMKGDKYGLISEEALLVSEPIFDDIILYKSKNGLSKGCLHITCRKGITEWSRITYVIARTGNKYFLYNISNGHQILNDCDIIKYTNFGHEDKKDFVEFEKEGIKGYVLWDESIVSTANYEEIKTILGYIYVKKDGKCGLIKPSGELLFPCDYDSIQISHGSKLILNKEGKEETVTIKGSSFYRLNESPTFSHYAGSYAQDEMGYSDDDIDTIFDGDPSAYWNID